LRGCFVTGTGTGVGKTVVAGSIVAALSALGVPVRARKAVLTGIDEPADPDWPPDHELLGMVAGCLPEEVAPLRYGPPVSPHLAAELAGRRIDPAQLLTALRAGTSPDDVLVVEGVGGLLVPLSNDYSVRDLAQQLGLPLVIAAGPGLGTINHTLLTLEAARAAGLSVAGVVLTPWPGDPGRIELSNRDTLALLGEVPVATLPRIALADVATLTAAGAQLPLAQWLGVRPAG
jgi:dethiobiotin synthetase